MLREEPAEQQPDAGVHSTLRHVLEVLGEPALQLVAAPAGLDVPVTEAVLLDPHAPIHTIPGGLLLAVGMRPRSSAARHTVRDAAEAGLAALVVKKYDEPTDHLANSAEECGIAVLAVDSEVSWHQVHLLIASALSAPREEPRSPTGPALGDLFGLANAIAASVGGATAIEDPRQRILAYSTVAGQAIDEDRRQGILGLQVPASPENAEQYRTLFRTNDVCRFPGVGRGLPRIAVAVRAGGETLGSIWVVDRDGSLGAGAERMLTHGASMAALHLLRARAAEELARRQQGELLRRVLEEGSSAGLVAPQLGLGEDAPVAVAAFTMVGQTPEPAAEQAALRLVDLVGLQCEARYGRPTCVLIGRTVYALIPAEGEIERHRQLVVDIVGRATTSLRLPVVGGLGSVIGGLRDTAKSREEADLVVRALLDDYPDGPEAATVDEVRAKVTLLQLAELLATRPNLLEGTWRRIQAHDALHGTEHGRTLRAYLDSGCDIPAAAEALAVHTNTCRYRLRQVQRQVGFDLSDPVERLVLWLHLATQLR